MRRTLTIDIEILPALEITPSTASALRAGQPVEDHLKTALNGDFGRILCIGFIDEDTQGRIRSGVLGWDEPRGRFTVDERGTLTQFWQLMKGFFPNRDRIVGHNIFDFDLKFIFKRSIVRGVRPDMEKHLNNYPRQTHKQMKEIFHRRL
jgi:hypothetical protein